MTAKSTGILKYIVLVGGWKFADGSVFIRLYNTNLTQKGITAMLLPEEIENQQFEVAFRGYNTREVDEFLNKIRLDISEMVREQETLRKKISAAELLAKDAKDHEEEFIASMKADKDAASEALVSARAEGERIIREAKNAAAGIMTEVRRRAAEISSESRKTAENIEKEARLAASEITASAKAEAEDKLFNARTEADNMVKAARAHADSIEAEARQNSAAVIEKAESSAALCEKYMNDLRASADALCRELDAELKNSAGRIALLGRRIASMNVASAPAIEGVDSPAASVSENPVDVSDISEKKRHIGAVNEASVEREPKHETAKAESTDLPEKSADDAKSDGGYFTEEYRQVMEELFGKGAHAAPAPASAPEDDDTYDYLDKVSDFIKESENGGEDDLPKVTSEYTGIPSGGADDANDAFSSSSIERIYKTPNDDDISDILSEF